MEGREGTERGGICLIGGRGRWRWFFKGKDGREWDSFDGREGRGGKTQGDHSRGTSTNSASVAGCA